MGDQYPEHEKLHKVEKQSFIIGQFLEWLQSERQIVLGYHTEDGQDLYRYLQSDVKLLAEYFNIDLEKLEQEKRTMLEDMRKANVKNDG